MIDIILLVIFILIFWFGYKKGFIRIFKNIFGVLASYIAAYFLYKPVTEQLMNTPLKDKIYNFVAEKSTVSNAGISIDFSPEFLVKPIENAINSGIETVADNVIMAATWLIMNILSAVLVFILAFIGVKIVFWLLNKAAKLPVINQANKLIGMIIGAISGLVCIYIAGMILISLSAVNPEIQSLVSGSYILRWIF